YGVQDPLYARGLPVERWRAIASATDPARLIAEIAREIETHFDVTVAQDDPWKQGVVWAVSTVGGLIPSAFVLVALVALVADLIQAIVADPNAPPSDEPSPTLPRLLTLVGKRGGGVARSG